MNDPTPASGIPITPPAGIPLAGSPPSTTPPGDTWDEHANWEDWEEPAAPPAQPPSSPAVPRRRLRKVAQSTPTSPTSAIDSQDDYESFPTPARRGRGCLTMLVVLAMIAACVFVGVTWVRNQIDPSGPPGAVVVVAVPKGTSGSEVGKLLHRKGVIGNDKLWRVWSQSKGISRFQAGRYNFKRHSSFSEAVAVLRDGPSVAQKQNLTIPEGLRLTQIADRVAKLPDRTAARFLEAAKSGNVRSRSQPVGSNDLEGLLFPDTYSIDLNENETAILTRMAEEFDSVALEVGLDKAQDQVGISPYEAVIVASLIEREAKFDDERGKVARVIYNRLKAKTALQIDATLIYANGGNQVLFDDLKVDGPFNTYTRKGLPPTPISMPGKASLKAALNPTEGNWLYYVVTEADGHSSFAPTFKQHKANIALAKKRGLR